MQRIRLTYKSSEVTPSVYLLLYFRMTGIYVYERFFDADRSKSEKMRSLLSRNEDINISEPRDGFDLDIYCIADANDYKMYLEEYGQEKEGFFSKRIVLCSEELELLPFEQTANIRMLKYRGESEQLLIDIVDALYDMMIVPGYTKDELHICREIYISIELWKISLLGKYFYIAESMEQYKNMVQKYRNGVDLIFSRLRKTGCNWGDKEYIHLQYAALNLAYEGNQYCIRNSKTLIYKSAGIADVCEQLLNKGIEPTELSDSFNMLLAQIYDDLLKDANKAYPYYLLACKDYNAYAFYRKGIYWQEYAKDYNKAIKYYSQSVHIYPEYYRAWYRLGNCFMLTNKCREALEIFRHVNCILKPRLETKKIRPMEIEYLFKAQNRCAYICNKVLNNKQQSIRENMEAIKAWEAIDNSSFFEFFKEEEETTRKRVKKELNILKIYMEIYKLADKIGDSQLKKEYSNKIEDIL